MLVLAETDCKGVVLRYPYQIPSRVFVVGCDPSNSTGTRQDAYDVYFSLNCRVTVVLARAIVSLRVKV